MMPSPGQGWGQALLLLVAPSLGPGDLGGTDFSVPWVSELMAQAGCDSWGTQQSGQSPLSFGGPSTEWPLGLLSPLSSAQASGS